jgi:hypothetical protein
VRGSYGTAAVTAHGDASQAAHRRAARMSRRLTALAVATASATLILTAPTALAVVVAHPVTTTDPAAAAAGWLSQQLIDGSHLVFSFDGKTFDGGGTADLSFALAAAKSGAKDINAAVSYLAAHVADYTMINDKSGKPGPSDGAIGKSAVAAMVAGDDPTSFGGYNLLQTLKADECTAISGDPKDFSVPVCPAVGAGRNTFSSIAESFTVLAEARGSAIDASYAPSSAAVGYLLSLQCPNGGFTTSTTGGTSCSSDVDATGYAMMALQALGGQGNAIGKAADWRESTRASKRRLGQQRWSQRRLDRSRHGRTRRGRTPHHDLATLAGRSAGHHGAHSRQGRFPRCAEIPRGLQSEPVRQGQVRRPARPSGAASPLLALRRAARRAAFDAVPEFDS